MMETQVIDKNTSVQSVLEQWPQTIPVFLRHRMVCVGCYMSPFDTLEEAAANYCLDTGQFIKELELVVGK
jgi:hybrid cluster-associated redox disulfide protein